jgi:hypothetical protein
VSASALSNKCINLMRRSAEIDSGGAAHRLCTERSAYQESVGLAEAE